MKKNYLITLCTALSLVVSCDSSDGPEDTNNKPLTVESGKEELEENSIELLNKIETFKDNDELNDIVELADFLNAEESQDNNIAMSTIANISSLQTKNQDIVSFNAKQAIAIVAETPIADDFEEEKGIYTWDDNLEEFTKTAESDDIIYNVNYNNKTAIFSVTDFKTALTGSESDNEVPTRAVANLKINNKTVFSQDYSATLQAGQLIPSKIENTTKIAAFAFVTSYTNTNNKSIKQDFSFKIDNDVITAYQYTVNGDFTNEDADNVEEIIDDTTMSFQFLDAKLLISANDKDLDSNDELSVDQQVTLLNSNTSAVLSINNREIANSEFYKDQDTFTDFIFNPNTDRWEEEEVSEDIVNVRFLFEDGTTNDFETYIDGSFTSLENKFEDVFEAYENLFSDL